MTGAGVGMRWSIERRSVAGDREGPVVSDATLQRVELEVRDKWPAEAFERLRLRLIRMYVGGGDFLADPRACRGGWVIRRTT